MSTAWKLNGTLASSLGITNITLDRKSQRPDELTLTVAAAFDAADIFSHGTTVKLTRNDGSGDVTYFVGRCERDDRVGTGNSEHHTIKVLGPWWYLENRIYQQSWTQITDPAAIPPTTVNVLTTFCILGLAADNSLATQGAVMTEALNYCIASGAPFQLGTIADAGQIPFDQCNDITCAEVLHRMLRWAPDAVVWWDYTTTLAGVACPTVNITRRGTMTAASLPAVADSTHHVSEVQAQPCYSLQLQGVRVRFCVDSSPFPTTIQEAGTLTGFQILETTVRLAANNAQVIQNAVTVADLTVDPIDHSFWFGAHPELRGYTNVTLHDGDLGNTNTWPSWLVYGTITDWMVNNQGIHADECHAVVLADYTIGGTVYKDQKLTYDYIATDAETKSYTWSDNATPIEAVPTGLADMLYAALGPLHYEGSITLVDTEIGIGAAMLGKTLNLTSGKTAWATMAALIIGVREELYAGRTTISYGPPPCLSAEDLMAVVRANRIRNPAGTAGAKKAGGQLSSDTTPTVGGKSSAKSTPSGVPQLIKKLVVDDNAGHTVTIDPADASDVVFDVLFVTGYGTSGAALHSIPVMKKGDVLVITGSPTNLANYDCP